MRVVDIKQTVERGFGLSLNNTYIQKFEVYWTGDNISAQWKCMSYKNKAKHLIIINTFNIGTCIRNNSIMKLRKKYLIS